MSDTPDYSKLEDLLFRGFLTARVYVNGIPIVLKTINESEKRMILDHTDGGRTDLYFTYALAYSTYMVNRVNVLPMRPDIIHKLVETYQNWTNGTIKKVFAKAKFLNEKASQKLAEIRPYTFGFESEQMWITSQNIALSNPSLSGVDGTEKIGLNYHQKIWMYFHRYLDDEDQFNRDFDLFAFVASATNPKGTKKAIEKHDKSRKEQDEEREQMHKTKRKNPIREKGGQLWVSNESGKDLISELEQSLQGQKDFHDRVVEAYEKRAAKGYHKKRARWEEQKRKKRQEAAQFKGPNKQKAVFYDPDQAEKLTKERRARQKQQLSDGAFETAAKFDDQERMLAKWGLIEAERDDLYEHAPSLNENENENDGSFYEDTLLEDYMEPMDDDLHNGED